MKNCNHANHCIQCNVASCQNHCNSEDYCSLDCVCIGTHETDPAMNQCTDCRSFRNRDINEQTQAVEQTKQQKQQQSGMTF